MAFTLAEYHSGGSDWLRWYESGTVTLAGTISVPVPCLLESVLVHINPAGTAGTVTVVVDSALGSAYDTTISSSALGTADPTSNIVYHPSADLFLAAGDAIVVSWDNAQSAEVGVVVQAEEPH